MIGRSSLEADQSGCCRGGQEGDGRHRRASLRNHGEEERTKMNFGAGGRLGRSSELGVVPQGSFRGIGTWGGSQPCSS